MRHKLSIAAVVLMAALVAACAPKLGDDCSNSFECAATGDRYCDISQPGGYCTIQNCEPGACGDEGVCVRFKPEEPRLSSNWCMAKCSGSCDRDKYVCRSADQLNQATDGGTDSPKRAEVLDDKKGQRFCVVRDGEE